MIFFSCCLFWDFLFAARFFRDFFLVIFSDALTLFQFLFNVRNTEKYANCSVNYFILMQYRNCHLFVCIRKKVLVLKCIYCSGLVFNAQIRNVIKILEFCCDLQYQTKGVFGRSLFPQWTNWNRPGKEGRWQSTACLSIRGMVWETEYRASCWECWRIDWDSFEKCWEQNLLYWNRR